MAGIRIPAPAPLVRRWLRFKTRTTQRLPPTWPAIVGCSLGLVMFAAMLVGVAYEVGRGHDKSAKLGAALAATVARPAVALGLGAVLVLAAGACFRRLWFEHLVRRPGPIRVGDLQVPRNLDGVDAAQLSATFRQRLQQLRLQAPAPLPGAMPEEDFLQMLEPDKLDAKNPLATAVRLIRAAVPKHAYEVTGALVAAPAAEASERRCGVTAQLKRLPHEAIPVETAWAASWEDAVIESADTVIAAVLPRTRLSNGPPWSGWRRYTMPALLVHHFERAESLCRDRRYDEALARYLRALELDPKSVDLRLQLGFVYEKLGLHLDALAAYLAAVTMADETSKSLYRHRARRHRTASGRTARYRLAVLLSGTGVSHQWRKRSSESPTPRDRQRDRLRAGLRPQLLDLLAKHGLIGNGTTNSVTASPPWSRGDIEGLLDQSGDDDLASPCLRLRNVTSHLAERILVEVHHEVRSQWGPRTWLSPLVVRLTISWIELRRGWLRYKLGEEREWEPDPRGSAGSDREFRTGSEHYNAACLYALPLLVSDPSIPEERTNEFVCGAVRHLAKAMSSTTSWYVASRRDWVLSEDPDLAGLREHPEFKQVEATYFPSASRPALRPLNAHRWELSRYAVLLVAETGRRWRDAWQQRALAPEGVADVDAVARLCRDEARAWTLVQTMAGGYRDWTCRFALVDAMRRWSDEHGFAPLEVSVPRFEWPSPEPNESEVATEIDANVRRLKSVAAPPVILELQPQERTLLERQAAAGNADNAQALPYLPYLRTVHMRLWTSMADWLAERRVGDDGAAAFADAVKATGELARLATSLVDPSPTAPPWPPVS